MKPWLNEYPEGTVAEIDPDAAASVGEVLAASCEEFADRPAYTNLGRTLSFRDLDQLSQQFGNYLTQSLGLKKGDRIAIMMPNLLQYPIVLFGALRCGLVVVNCNPLYTPRELEHQLNDSGAEAIVIIENVAHTLSEIRERVPTKTVITTRVGDMLSSVKGFIVNFALKHVKKAVPAFDLPGAIDFRDAMSQGAGLSGQPVEITGDDLAFLQYTGGTTGVSKGAMLTHRNIVANLEQVAAWFANDAEPGKEIIITALPLYHVFALTCNCLCYMKFGGLNVLISDPRDMGGFIKEMGRWPFTAITGVNTLFNGLLAHPEFANLDFSNLKMASAGGMAVQQATADKWERVTGTVILEGYGLTETSPCATTNPPNIEKYSGTIGLPLPSTLLSLRDDDGNEVPLGEPGEICIQGPQVMKGYWNRPEATDEVFTEDGFLLTGDIAIMDERGYFRIVDRKKDMILVSGFNVFPNEIENVVTQMDGILEVACIGIPDPKSTEAVKIFVVLEPGAALTADEIRAYCRDQMTAYKVPKHIEFAQDLPKSNVGKILRRELRDAELAKAS